MPWLQPLFHLKSLSNVRHEITQSSRSPNSHFMHEDTVAQRRGRLATRVWRCVREQSASRVSSLTPPLSMQQKLSDPGITLCNLLNCGEDMKEHAYSAVFQNCLGYLLKMEISNFLPYSSRDLHSGFHSSFCVEHCRDECESLLCPAGSASESVSVHSIF